MQLHHREHTAHSNTLLYITVKYIVKHGEAWRLEHCPTKWGISGSMCVTQSHLCSQRPPMADPCAVRATRSKGGGARRGLTCATRTRFWAEGIHIWTCKHIAHTKTSTVCALEEGCVREREEDCVRENTRGHQLVPLEREQLELLDVDSGQRFHHDSHRYQWACHKSQRGTHHQ